MVHPAQQLRSSLEIDQTRPVAAPRIGNRQDAFRSALPRTLLACLALLCWGNGNLRADSELEFNRDIRPILSNNCFACHGFDSKSRQGELRLDIPEGAFAEREGTPAITPGNLSASLLWERITTTDPDQKMPPTDSHLQLKDAEIATLKRWIEQGATYQKHWAFEAPRAAEIPAVKHADWPKTPIDNFILARLEAQGLAPSPEADRATLIRRVSFALTGLPPTSADVQRYLEDASPRAYEDLVERYLASPQHGEEMARHWLDLARYADTHGLSLDNEREMWAYRDWVIEAFNRNLPFDQFTIDQLAGDLLPDAKKSQLVATGFNRCNITSGEGGSITEELLYRYAVERTSTTIETWLGLTGGCAVCHDHKYDPLSTREFYSLYAFFSSAADPAMDGNIRTTKPFVSLATPEQETELSRLKAAEQAAITARDELVARLQFADPVKEDGTVAAELPAVNVTETLFDDLLPLHATVKTKTRNAVTWTPAAELPCPSGLRSWKQAAAGNYYDTISNHGVPWVMPHDGIISVWVRTDEKAPPRAIMLEFKVGKETRRAIWGDASLVGSGTIGKPERFRVGDLPPPGEWKQLSVTAQQLAWKPGLEAETLNLVEFDGVVWWDALTFSGTLAPQEDPRASFQVWWKRSLGWTIPGVPEKLTAILKAGPKPDVPEEQLKELKRYYLTQIARPSTDEWKGAQEAVQLAEARRKTLEDDIPGTFMFSDLPEPRPAHVMVRGQYDQPGEAVQPSTPAALPALVTDGRPSRLDLAKWFLSEEQPLTARVAVNRYWQQFFGIGLVETSSDFGSQGTPPSHPELLDWLAVRYRQSGWQTRDLIRLIVNSAAFRQQSVITPAMLERDPKNRLLAHGPRFRLDAEQVRDQVLFTSGLLSFKRGGPGAKFYQPSNLWEPIGYADSNTRYYLQDHGDKIYRRSIYAFLKRTAPPPFLSNFDAPNREQACTRRDRSNTPLQALQLMNDIQHVEAARGLAARVLKESAPTPIDRLKYAWKLVLVREPEQGELDMLQQTLQKHLQRFGKDKQAAAALIHVGESAPPAEAPVEELAAYTLIANLLFNLDETITRN